jgi:hypothetical protein
VTVMKNKRFNYLVLCFGFYFELYCIKSFGLNRFKHYIRLFLSVKWLKNTVCFCSHGGRLVAISLMTSKWWDGDLIRYLIHYYYVYFHRIPSTWINQKFRSIWIGYFQMISTDYSICRYAFLISKVLYNLIYYIFRISYI